MFRLLTITFGVTACLFFSGCMAIGGPCGGGITCNNCDGYSREIGGPPVRRFARNIACGGGCGDVYVDEWRNYSPNYCDPCESRGGCRPFMGALGNLFGYRDAGSQTCYGGDRQFFGLMGGMVTDGVCGGADCCDSGCDSGCGAGVYNGACSDGSCGSTGGCSSCGIGVSPRSTNLLSSRPQVSSRSQVSSRPQVTEGGSNVRPVFYAGGGQEVYRR